MQKRRPVMLVILDGFGWREERADNAVALANKPAFDKLWTNYPRAFLRTSGRDVGLPDGQMGNSEVGHLNIGAGRVVMQDLPRINDAIADGSIAKSPALTDLIAQLKITGGVCHLIGLMSPGGVHSHQDHAVALAKILDAAGIATLVHVFTDGRDTPPQSGADDLARFADALPASARIATLSGRYYAMDRDNRWERVKKAYGVIVDAGVPHSPSAAQVISGAYAAGITDEFVVPSTIGNYSGMRDGDALLSFNFRADRMRELLDAILDHAFGGFVRQRIPKLCAAVGMTQYSEHLDAFMRSIFPPQAFPHILGDVVAAAGRTQLRMAETEKYPHVTYFLNGGEEDTFNGEGRIMVPSPKVATYDLQPEMSAPELGAKAVDAIASGQYDLIVLNFANPDMVGHTGSLPAAIKAVETVDICLGRIADAITKAGGALLVTADHGNCELMRDPITGGPHTSHTTNPVPVVLMADGVSAIHDGRLADIAPTLLALMDLRQPPEMTGRSLIGP